MKPISIAFMLTCLLIGLAACDNKAVQPSSLESQINADPVDVSEDGDPPIRNNPEQTDWKEAYVHYLKETDFVAFYLGDLNGDGIEELVIRYNDYSNGGEILYYTGNNLQILDLGVISAWGDVGYLEDTNQIIFLKWYGHTTGTFGSVEFYLYEWTAGGYAETLSVIRESGYDPNNDGNGEYGQGYINREQVDFDEFEAVLAEMYALLEESAWFPMTDADELDDYMDRLMQWELENSHR